MEILDFQPATRGPSLLPLGCLRRRDGPATLGEVAAVAAAAQACGRSAIAAGGVDLPWWIHADKLELRMDRMVEYPT